MVDFLYNMEAIQNYYDDGMTAMATFQVGATKTTEGARALSAVKNVPQEFLDKLPPGGAMPAPAGACVAAAKPQVTFMTKGSDAVPPEAVTPELIAEKDIQTIPSELVTIAQNDPDSLASLIEDMVPMGDLSLATPQGWDNLLWSKLREMQQPAESLMDYQLWNASSEIMQQISS